MLKVAARPSRYLLGLAILMHGLIFLYDWLHDFSPFLQGDRSYGRMEALQDMMMAPLARATTAMAYGDVIPSEYLFQLPCYWLGGVGGIILFQIVLTVLSVLCVGKLAAAFFTWRHASFTAGAIYLLLPQNLVFAHQFVTEATATPFMVFFLYFMVGHLRSQGKHHAIYAGLFLGLAIFVRPSLVLLLPALAALVLIYRTIPLRSMATICAMGLLLLTLWVALFTATTGHVGYTNGVANLDWNLRSKVFLVDQANGFEKHEEVKSFDDYEELYGDASGISPNRFFEIVSEHPMAYVKVAVTDAAIVFGKGNATKLLVDYFGIARDSGIKGWRDVWEKGGTAALINWAMGNMPMLLVFMMEIIVSLVTVVASAMAVWFVAATLLSKRKRTRMQPAELGLVLIMAALLLTVLASAEMVDRAQARLRHPAEAGIILLVGMMLRTKRMPT